MASSGPNRKTLPKSTHLSDADSSLKARGALAGGNDKDVVGSILPDASVEKLRAQEKAAFDYLARRGSEADKTGDEEEEFDDEAMANAERDLAEDAEWKRIQKNTFTRWANEHLKQANKQIDNLENDLSDGLRLIALIEVLSGKRMPRHNKKPVFRSQKLENVSIALNFLEMEGITLVNIDSTDIVDCKLKLILGLIWTLILHYAISMPMWDGPPLGGGAQEKTPKQRLMGWVKDKMPDVPMNNFTKDWQDGKAIGALVDSVAPGLCPDWEDWDPKRPVENATEAMDLADKWLNVPKLLKPEEMVDPNVDEQSMMTYLSQFPNSKVKPGAPLRKKTNVGKVRAYGPGLEARGLVARAPAKFTIETFGAGDGDVRVEVIGPNGQPIPCEVLFNNDRKKTYSCRYFPEEEGNYVVKIFFATREIPKSPFNVCVEGFAGDASVVTASGPGLEAEGVVINKTTHFHIFAQDAGRGTPEVIILDPKGNKDSVPLKILPTDEPDVYKCEYVATVLGLHSVNVFFAGNPIPHSPFGVKVSPASLPSKVWTSGRGLQPNGIRVNETVSFKVHTEGAGEGEPAVKILGPGGLPIRATSKKIDNHTTEYTYTPLKQGRHIVMITFANQEIPKSPFEVNISSNKKSNIKAYGPGLKGGIVNRPARFTVDTNGETGGLGFSIKGPSQAEINCSDNGDGSADVDYIPTAVGEYAVHILNDGEDIPGSPYMANILPQTDFYPEKVKVFGPGIENGVNPKETTYFTIDISDAGDAPLDVSILDDLGEFEPKIEKESEGIFRCTYQPRKKQHKQTVMVNFGGVAVPGSPFRVQNDNLNDPSLVKVYGPGVEDGVQARKPIDFTVDCRKSGPGDLQVSIESKTKKKVPISLKDNKDGTHLVSYEAPEPGTQTIIITLDGKEVPQSPIHVNVKPGLDLSKIKLKDFETEVFVDCTNEFDVDTSDLPPNHTATVECFISGPSGEPVDAFVNKDEPNGPFHVSYIPKEEGEHDIHLKYNGQVLPDSPFPVVALEGFDPTRVQAFGDGLDQGFVDEPNEFTIDTKNAGAGGLGLAIEGPSEATMTCNDNKDGTATVEYVPTEEGDYDVAIRFGDEHIPGSPFKVPVVSRDGVGLSSQGRGNPDAKKVSAYGPGLEPGNVFPGKPTEFIVDSSGTSDAPVKVEIRDSDGKLVPKRPIIAKKPKGIHEVSYVPPPVGDPYEIAVKYNGDHIPDSPFLMTSNPNLDEFIDSPRSLSQLGSRKPSRDSDHLDSAYTKNGTGIQRKSSKDSEGRGVADLIRNTLPSGFGKERGGSPDEGDDAIADRSTVKPFDRTNSRDMSRSGPGTRDRNEPGRAGTTPSSRPTSSRTSRDYGAHPDIDGSRRASNANDGGHGAGAARKSLGGVIGAKDGSTPDGRRGYPSGRDEGSRKSSRDSQNPDGKDHIDSRRASQSGGSNFGSRKSSRDDEGNIIGSKRDARGPTSIVDQRRRGSRDHDGSRRGSNAPRAPNFKKNSKGLPIDESGKTVPLDKFGRPVDSEGRHIDENGHLIDSRTPQFRKDSRGNPVDENERPYTLDKKGRPINNQGHLIDEFGRPIDEYGRPLNPDDFPLDTYARPADGRVPRFRRDSGGNLVDEYGQPLQLDQYGRPIDDQGRLIDEYGRPIDARDPLFKRNSKGQVVDSDGRPVDVDQFGRPINKQGSLVDELGRAIDEYGRPIDEFGRPINSSGQPISPYRGSIDNGTPKFRKDSRGRPLDVDGHPLPTDELGRPIDAQGNLIDELGNPVLASQPKYRKNSRGQIVDANGVPMQSDSHGRPINKQGQLVDGHGGLIDDYGKPVDSNGFPLSDSSPHFDRDSNGNPLDVNGRPLNVDDLGRPIDEAGRLVDEFSNPIDSFQPNFRKNSRGLSVGHEGKVLKLDKQGRPVNEHGQLVNEHDKPIDCYGNLLHDDKMPEGHQPRFRKDSKGSPVDEFGRKLATDKYGRPIDDQGRLIDEYGRPLDSREPLFKKNSRGVPVDENNAPFSLDKYGRPINEKGHLIDEFERPIDEYGRPLNSSQDTSSHPMPSARLPFLKKDPQGNFVDPSGSSVPVDKNGCPIDKNGRPIDEYGMPLSNSAIASGLGPRVPQFKKDSRGNPTDNNGKTMMVDSEGRPINEHGNLIDEFGIPIDEYGKPLASSGQTTRRAPNFNKDLRGNPVDHNGRPLPLDSQGHPVDAQGRPIDEFGRPLDSYGQPANRAPTFRKDSRGNPVDHNGKPLPVDSQGRPVDAQGRPIDEFGLPLDNYGQPANRAPTFRKDSRGNPVDHNGKPLPIDSQGRPVDAQGRPIDEYGRPLDSYGQPSGRAPQFRKDSRGNPIDHNGKPLPVDSQGRPVDAQGRPIDEYGRPLDSYGQPASRVPQFRKDSRGNPIDHNGKPLPLDSQGHPVDAQGRQIDEYGRLIDGLGRPIDEYGRPSNNFSRIPQFRKNSRGTPIDHDGKPFEVDSQGQPINNIGQLIDEFGNPIDKYGRPLDGHQSESGRGPHFKRNSIGQPLDLYGKPLNADSQGRPVNSQGQPVDEFGRPIDEYGRPLEESLSRGTRVPQFRKDSSGHPLDQSGRPLLVDELGRPIDDQGQLIDEYGRAIDETGRPIYDSAHEAPRFKKDSNGKPVDKDGKPFNLDPYGRPIDGKGRLINETESPLESSQISGRVPSFKTDSSGTPLDHNGMPLPVDTYGRPIDAHGRPIDEFGIPMDGREPAFRKDSKGNPVNAYGRTLPVDNLGRPVDGCGKLIDEFGRPIDVYGRPIDDHGRLLDKNGKPLECKGPYEMIGGRKGEEGGLRNTSGDVYGNRPMPFNDVGRESVVRDTRGVGFVYDPSSEPNVASRRTSGLASAHPSSRKPSDIVDQQQKDRLDSNGNDRANIRKASSDYAGSNDSSRRTSQQSDGSGRGKYGSRPGSRQDLFEGKSPYGSRSGSRASLYNNGVGDDPAKRSHGNGGSRNSSRNDTFETDDPDNHDPTSTLGRHQSRPNVFGGHPNSQNNHLPLELNNIPLPCSKGEVDTVVRTPSGNIVHPYVEDNGNGSVGVSFQPQERGPHSLDVKHNGEHVQGSPYKFYSSPLEEGHVHAHGPGLVHAVCGDPADFVISTKGAGAGGLALAVEGPSKAEINCTDNKDGTVNVSYLPTAPGEYKISAKFADKHIEGSPFTCKVTGEGKKRNAISVGSSSELSLPDNLSDYDLRALDAYIISPSGNEEPCFLKKLPQGNTGISFTPKETGEHLVSVKRNEKHIKNSPFKIVVKPDDVGDASRVKVTGRALSEGRTQQDNTFHIDTKNAGYGGLSLSVEGPSKAEINCKDHEDGSLDVSYCPTQPGLYIINLKFADQHVPGSPFAAAISGPGLESKHERINHLREAVPVTEVGSQCRLTFKMPGINARDLETEVKSPSGKVNKAAITEIEDGLYAVNFVPYELGIHTVSVQYHDLDIPGSPFQFTVGPLQDGGAHRVHAGGSGLERGVQGQPTDFNIWTREAGHGSLAISVEGPSKAVVDFKDRKDGSCFVSYTVEEPGEYSVGIRFNDQHIPGSPYKVYIQPASDEAERIRMSNLAESPVKPDAPQTMLLNMNGADGDVECRIVAPSGREDDCFLTPLGNGEHSVRFVPKEEGVHYLHARFKGVHIPDSPFKIIVGNLNANNDPSTVSVSGRGIQTGITGEKSTFVIDTSSVGAGTLSITVDGPSKVDLACNEVDNGYEVSYTPMVPGRYYVTVKYNGKNITGSPFSVYINGENLGDSLNRQRKSSRSSMTMETLKRTSYIRHQYTESRTSSSQSFSRSMLPLQGVPATGSPDTKSDFSKVRCAGSGLMNARTLRHNSFQVDCSQAGDNILFVGIWGPDVPCEEVVIKHQGNKKYSVDYYVKDKGKYIIYIKWGDDHIPGSPFHIEAV